MLSQMRTADYAITSWFEHLLRNSSGFSALCSIWRNAVHQDGVSSV